MGLKELMTLVPQFGMYQLAQLVGLVEIGLGFVLVACQLGYVANSPCIAIHIGIDTGTQVFLLSSATDGFLHSVLHVSLPIVASVACMGRLPMVVFPFQ